MSPQVRTLRISSFVSSMLLALLVVCSSFAYAADRNNDNRDSGNRDSYKGRSSDSSSGRDSHSRGSNNYNHSHGNYQDLGQIWKDRQSNRGTVSTSRSYTGTRYNDNVNTRGSRVTIDNSQFSGRYKHYGYDYRSDRVFPSPFSLYLGLYPPYLDRSRVVIVAHSRHLDTFVNIPIYFRHSRGYYNVGDSYYSDDYTYRDLAQVMQEIHDAWIHEDADAILRHVRHGANVDIYLDGEYSYSVSKEDYRDLTNDAMDAIRTASFEFDHTRLRNGAQAVAYGKHVYYDEGYAGNGGDRKTVYVSYTFERSGGDWYITEVGTSDQPLD